MPASDLPIRPNALRSPVAVTRPIAVPRVTSVPEKTRPGSASPGAVVPAPGLDEAELLRLAASVERASEHPLANAIVAERDRPPFAALTRFYDPSVRFGLQFDAIAGVVTETEEDVGAVAENAPDDQPASETGTGTAAVVSLDAFRKK